MSLLDCFNFASEVSQRRIDRIDITYLLAFCLQKSQSFLYAHPEYVLSKPEQAHFEDLIQKRAAGWPIAYLTGEKAFYDLTFKVTPDTLIPRPETELLVERVLSHIQALEAPNILELGTGSGAIALSLAHARPDAHITATDISANALAVAHENAALLHLEQVQFIASNWFDSLPTTQYRVIVSNPPYIAATSPYLDALSFEPQNALVSGASGLDALRHIIENARRFLSPGGVLCLEHGYDQAEAVQACFKKAGYRTIETFQDFSGQDRVTEGYSFKSSNCS